MNKLLCTFIILIAFMPKIALASVNSVYVEKVFDDHAIISTSGGKYLIEKGVGCLSLWFYEGRSVLIDSPGVFLGSGSRIIIPDRNQNCPIWKSSMINEQTNPQQSSTQQPTNVQPPVTQQNSGQINTQTNPDTYKNNANDTSPYSISN